MGGLPVFIPHSMSSNYGFQPFVFDDDLSPVSLLSFQVNFSRFIRRIASALKFTICISDGFQNINMIGVYMFIMQQNLIQLILLGGPNNWVSLSFFSVKYDSKNSWIYGRIATIIIIWCGFTAQGCYNHNHLVWIYGRIATIFVSIK